MGLGYRQVLRGSTDEEVVASRIDASKVERFQVVPQLSGCSADTVQTVQTSTDSSASSPYVYFGDVESDVRWKGSPYQPMEVAQYRPMRQSS